LTPNLEFIPRNPSADSGSQRLRPRFFGCKSCRKAFRAHPLAPAIGNLMVGINPPQKPIAVSLDGLRDPIDLNQIDAGPDQHADHITMG
jgi:hypothetical protein